jgi:Protein of unknown function (DUF3024)
VIPELDQRRIARWVDGRKGRLPEAARDKIRYELDVTPTTATILECRPPWRADFGPEWTRFPIARLRYTKTKREWSLYWRDRNVRSHSYELAPPSSNVEDLLAEVNRDPTGIFGG